LADEHLAVLLQASFEFPSETPQPTKQLIEVYEATGAYGKQP